MTPEEKEAKSVETKEFTERVHNLSVEVYKIRLEQGSGSGAVERMLEDDNDGGAKLRARAILYDPLTRAYLKVLNIT